MFVEAGEKTLLIFALCRHHSGIINIIHLQESKRKCSDDTGEEGHKSEFKSASSSQFGFVCSEFCHFIIARNEFHLIYGRYDPILSPSLSLGLWTIFSIQIFRWILQPYWSLTATRMQNKYFIHNGDAKPSFLVMSSYHTGLKASSLSRTLFFSIPAFSGRNKTFSIVFPASTERWKFSLLNQFIFYDFEQNFVRKSFVIGGETTFQ